MEPAGSTNQPIGVSWGWQSLVGGAPSLSRQTGNDETSTLLKNYASSTDECHLLTKASDIANAFNLIGTELLQLRTAKQPLARPSVEPTRQV